MQLITSSSEAYLFIFIFLVAGVVVALSAGSG
jgi:hypothetical protein